MQEKITSFIRSTSSQMKRMSDMLKKLKEDQEELEHDMVRPESPKKKKKKLEPVEVYINAGSVARACLIVIGMALLSYFLIEIKEIILIFFISIFFAAALDPTIDALQKYKIPRSVSVIGMFALLLGVLVLFISQLVPLLADQLVELARSLNGLVNQLFVEDSILSDRLTALLGEVDRSLLVDQMKNSLEAMAGQLQSLTGNTWGAIVGIFSSILNFILILVLTFFLVVDEKSVDEFFLSLFPSKHAAYIIEKTEAIKHKVGYWLRGQVIMMCLMFIISLVAYMFILDLDYALTLAMFAAITEVVPVVGPFISGAPAILVAFNHSPLMALFTLITIIIIQQIEGNVLLPIVMRKAVGLNPIIIILAMLVGYATLGVLGVIIAVPVATALAIFVNDYSMKKK